jgi:hypothetical protein
MELHEALAQIAEIRDRVAATQSFRGYRAVPVAASGMLAILAALVQPFVVAEPMANLREYLTLWVGIALLGGGTGATGIWLRLRAGDSPLGGELTRLAVSQFLPCLAAGALVTFAIARQAPEVAWLLPGLWQVLFSLGIFASWRLLPRATVAIGAFYLLAGACNLALGQEAGLSPWAMGLPFGAGQLATAAILYWNLERDHGG